MQRERRRDPYPWTWEIPAAVALVSGLVLVLGLQLGRSIANLVAGAGWTWPDATRTVPDGPFASPIGSTFWTSAPGVVSGDSGAGLPQRDIGSAQLASRALMWGSLLATEVLVVAALAWAAILILHRWGPSRMRGMATSAEAERLLGVTRLRHVAAIVRPDLHSGHALATSAVVPRAEHRTSVDHAEHSGSRLGRGLSFWLLAGRGDRGPASGSTGERR